MATFSVRAWLADQLGCQPDQLDLLEDPQPTRRGPEARYVHDNGTVSTVLITWAVPDAGRRGTRMVVATLPAGGALLGIDADNEIEW